MPLNDLPQLASGIVPRREIVRKVGAGQFALQGVFNDFPTIGAVEALLVEGALALSQGNRSIAAKMLGVSRPTLLKKLKQAAEKRSDED